MVNKIKFPGLVEAEKFLSLRKEIQDYLKKIYVEELYTPYNYLYYNGNAELYKEKILKLEDTSNVLIKDCIPLLTEWHLRQIIEQSYSICDMYAEPEGWEFKIEDIENGEILDIKTNEEDLLLAYLNIAVKIIHRELKLEEKDSNIGKGGNNMVRSIDYDREMIEIAKNDATLQTEDIAEYYLERCILLEEKNEMLLNFIHNHIKNIKEVEQSLVKAGYSFE